MIRCTTARVCLAAGGDASNDDSYPSGSLLLTRDAGETWRQIGTEAYFGIACVGGDACEIVGQSSGRAPLALRVTLSGVVRARWQGSAARFFRNSLQSVACAAPRDCYAVGDGGLVARTQDGAHWSAQALGLAGLDGVTCTGRVRCYAVGADSVILSTSPSGHGPVPTATPQGRSTGGSPPIPTLSPALPTPTEVPAGRGCPPGCAPGMVLYRADWTHGLDGWVARGGGAGGWHVKGGVLISPAATYQHPPTYLVPPFQPGAHGVADYAVEFQARPVTRAVDFHVSLRRQGQRYDDFAVSSCCTNRADVSIIYRDESTRSGYDTIIGDAQLPPLDVRWHTYRMEVRGESLRLVVDGRPLVRGLDGHLLAGGEIDLFGQDVPLMFRRLRIVDL